MQVTYLMDAPAWALEASCHFEHTCCCLRESQRVCAVMCVTIYSNKALRQGIQAGHTDSLFGPATYHDCQLRKWQCDIVLLLPWLTTQSKEPFTAFKLALTNGHLSFASWQAQTFTSVHCSSLFYPRLAIRVLISLGSFHIGECKILSTRQGLAHHHSSHVASEPLTAWIRIHAHPLGLDWYLSPNPSAEFANRCMDQQKTVAAVTVLPQFQWYV